jgi:hypothetical protein
MLPYLLNGLLDSHYHKLVIAWEQYQEVYHGERCPGGLTRSVAEELRYSN